MPSMDLSYVAVLEAITHIDVELNGRQPTYFLYVNPRELLMAFSVAKHIINLYPVWINVIPRPTTLKPDEWCLSAGGVSYGSPGA